MKQCPDTISLEEYNDAFNLWLTDEQSKLEKQINFEKLKTSMHLFKDTDGMVRLRGRFNNSLMQYEEKFPILLRLESWITKLIVRQAHENVLHHGVETTLANIRRKYWIIKGRKVVRDILRKCVTCIKFDGTTFKSPKSPDLPDFRLLNSHAY